MGDACTRIGDMKGTHGALVGRPDGKRPLERPRRIWEKSIKMALEETV
jgi:hypothetical protein